MHSDVVVMWCIPPSNSSPSFEVSAIFYPVKIEDIFVCGVDADCSVYYILLSKTNTVNICCDVFLHNVMTFKAFVTVVMNKLTYVSFHKVG